MNRKFMKEEKKNINTFLLLIKIVIKKGKKLSIKKILKISQKQDIDHM